MKSRRLANQKIRKECERRRVYLWELAEKFGVTDTYFSKMLRTEFDEETKTKAMKFIDEIAKQYAD